MDTTWSHISHWHCSLSVSACLSGSGTRTHPECLDETYVRCSMLTHRQRVYLKGRASTVEQTQERISHRETVVRPNCFLDLERCFELSVFEWVTLR